MNGPYGTAIARDRGLCFVGLYGPGRFRAHNVDDVQHVDYGCHISGRASWVRQSAEEFCGFRRARLNKSDAIGALRLRSGFAIHQRQEVASWVA